MSGVIAPVRIAVDSVVVDQAACRSLAALIGSRNPPLDHEDTSLTGFTAAEITNFYLILVAICHQTSPRGKKPLEGEVGGRHLRGWDYLSAKLEAAARADPAIVSPEAWARASEEEVRQLFRSETLGDRLSDPAGRAALVRDIGEQMLRQGWNSAEDIYRASGGFIAAEENGLLRALARFRAYDDPIQKKSFFYLAVMRNTGLWSYQDPQNLGAPVDYHEVRGHLRIGTVQVRDPELRAKLIAGQLVSAEEDIAIRRAVLEAIMSISEQSGLRNPSQLHYLFWNVFRSCCTRDNPHCYSCPPSCGLPERYVPLALFPEGRHCPFTQVCQSAGQEPKLVEHNFETDYY